VTGVSVCLGIAIVVGITVCVGSNAGVRRTVETAVGDKIGIISAGVSSGVAMAYSTGKICFLETGAGVGDVNIGVAGPITPGDISVAKGVANGENGAGVTVAVNTRTGVFVTVKLAVLVSVKVNVAVAVIVGKAVGTGVIV
jgi:hypothetical protein